MPQHWSEWNKTTSVLKWTRGHTALPPCCNCRRDAEDTQVRHWVIEPGTPIREIGYYPPSPQFRCAPRKGCNAEPWSKNGAHLREPFDGVHCFVRKSDRTRWTIAE